MRHKPRILVVHKRDAYDQYVKTRRDARMVQLLRRGHPELRDLKQAHVVHQQAVEQVLRALRRLPVTINVVDRASLSVSGRYALAVAVGGDGTFLHVARSVTHVPILGVNSDPQRSEAVFCGATATTCEERVRAALAGRLPKLFLYWLALALNGRMLRERALNDVLIAHDDPATLNRYRLRIGRRQELQKSSGLWVASAAGSSSAIAAAGGASLPWSARKFQYRPRELYCGRLSRPRLTGGVLPADATVRILWLMRRGFAYLDGPHIRIPLRFADELHIRLSLRDPVQVLGVPRTHSPKPSL